MSIAFTIGGVDYTSRLDIKSIEITDGLPSRSDSLSFTISLRTSEITGSGPYPPQGAQVVSLTVNNVKEFEGVISSVSVTPRVGNLETLDYSCSATDYTKFLDRKLIAKIKIAGNYAGAIARSLIQEHAPEFSTHNIQDGFPVPEQSFDYEPLSSIVDKLAQSVGYSWYVDFDKNVHFFSAISKPAPVSVIDLDSDLTIGNINYSEDVTRIKNRLYIKDASVRSGSKRNDTYVADGRQTFFPLFAPPYDHTDIAVTVDGVAVETRPDPLTSSEGELAGGAGFAFSCIINQGIRFGTDNIPPSGSFVDIEYNPTQQGEFVDVLEDVDSIRMMSAREGSSGVYEHVVSLPDFRVTDMSPLVAVGMLILDRLAWPIVSGTLETLQVQGWHSGQSFTLQSSERGLYDTKSLWKLGIKVSPKMYIQSVTKRINVTTNGAYMMQNTVQFSNIVSEVSF